MACTNGFRVSNQIVLTGGTGLLGRNLLELDNTLIAPTSKQCDILEPNDLQQMIELYQPKTIIHAAAYTDVKRAENDIISCMQVNIVGTFNVLKKCVENNVKMVYISTDAVFDGEKGNYTTEEAINPCSTYAKSKTSAELMVRAYKNSLIIRTSFFGTTFPYDKAFVDQWTSKDYIDIMAPKILKACLSEEYGIKHIHSKRRSLYELAKIRRKNVKPVSLKDYDFGFKMPKDLSLLN